RASCYEGGCLRGAFDFSAHGRGTPVNARRREFPLSAFSRFGLSRKGFATPRRWPRRSPFRERANGVRNDPSRSLPDPGISPENSRTLSLTTLSELTIRLLSHPGLAIPNSRRVALGIGDH